MLTRESNESYCTHNTYRSGSSSRDLDLYQISRFPIKLLFETFQLTVGAAATSCDHQGGKIYYPLAINVSPSFHPSNVRKFRLDQGRAPTHAATLECAVLFKISVPPSEFSPALTHAAGDVPSAETNMSVT